MGASVLFGTAAAAATSTTSATAATAGLFGAGGAFSAGQTLLTAGTVLSAGTSVLGGLAEAERMEDEANYIDQQNALAAKAEAEANEDRLASMRAQFGASGLKLEGTPLDVLEDSAANGAANVLAIRYGGTASSKSMRSGAGALKVTSPIGAGSSLLKGGSEIFGTV